MTDNERLFGPLRRRLLEPLEMADAVRRAINAPAQALTDCGVIETEDGVFRLFRGPSPGYAISTSGPVSYRVQWGYRQ